MRVGLGYDVHRFRDGRPLILGGEEIPHSRGLEGFSDADVLLHALADALLGAASLGDIGEHFPPGDERWRDISSVRLLEQVMEMIAAEGLRVVNVDLCVIAEEPKLAPHRGRIQRKIASVLDLDLRRVGLKATTHEGLGAMGRAEGIAAMAVALLDHESEG